MFDIYRRYNSNQTQNNSPHHGNIHTPPKSDHQPNIQHQPTLTAPQQKRQPQGTHIPQESHHIHQQKPEPQSNHNNNQTKSNSDSYRPEPQTNPKDNCHKTEHKTSKNKSITDFIQNLIPKSIYNTETKKIFGILEAEDLLIIALIFLFMEDKNGENNLIVLALIYVLLCDYINLDGFSF